jgi:thiosulfate dehydrogenase
MLEFFLSLSLAALAGGDAAADDLGSIHYGRRLITETYAFIGPEVSDPGMRFAGNNLACQNCHLDAGHVSGGLALTGVSTKYPLTQPDGRVETLADRVNGCMQRSMNGKPLPEDGKEMEAILAYLDMVTREAGSYGNPVEDPKPLATPATTPDPVRGASLYASHCTACHGADGAGQRNGRPGDALGYLHPPVWGSDSFNAAAGMHRVATLAAFTHANMPLGATLEGPMLTEQDAWDIAAYIEAQPRPPAPAGMEDPH